jgi:hypothetical protein
MSLLTKLDVQNVALTQNSFNATFKAVDAVIKTEAQKGNFTVAHTLVGAPVIALGPNLVKDLEVRGFTAAISGDDDEILTVSWNNA